MRIAYGFNRYEAVPVGPIPTFAHVLDISQSEDIAMSEWVVELFPQYFTVQHKGDTLWWSELPELGKHTRYELLRQCWAHFPEGSHDNTYLKHLAFHRWVLQEFSADQDDFAFNDADGDDRDDGFAEFLDDAVILAPEKAKESPVVQYLAPTYRGCDEDLSFMPIQIHSVDQSWWLVFDCLNHPGLVSPYSSGHNLIEWEDE